MTAASVQVRERPILFSGAMVRAILDGRKTQTRRVVKPQPTKATGAGGKYEPSAPFVHQHDGLTWGWMCGEVSYTWNDVRCPYGRPGDRLWVRETWGADFEWPDEGGPKVLEWGAMPPGFRGPNDGAFVHFRADGSKYGFLSDFDNIMTPGPVAEANPKRWRPSIHMPRWVSRLSLEITEVRVGRLATISSADARAEGFAPNDRGSETDNFHNLWDELNASRGYGWDANPWVWAISFRRIAE